MNTTCRKKNTKKENTVRRKACTQFQTHNFKLQKKNLGKQ